MLPRLAILSVCAGALLLFLVGTRLAWGADALTASEAWDGLSELSRLAARRVPEGRLKITQTIALDALTPQDAVVIVMPESRLEADSLTRFMIDGGKVAILDDATAASELLGRFSIRLEQSPLEPIKMLRASPSLPIATRARLMGKENENSYHPLAEGVTQLMTNHPKVLGHPNLSPVFEIDAKDRAHAAVVVTGVVGKGRLVVASDSSLLINQMLRYPGNRAFAGNLIDYLAPGSETGNVYLISGAFEQTGTYGESSLAERLRQALSNLKELVREAEQKGLPEPLLMALSLSLFFMLVATQLWPTLKPHRERAPLFVQVPRPVAPLSSRELSHAALVATYEDLDAALREATRLPEGASVGSVSARLIELDLSEGERVQLEELRSELEKIALGQARPGNAVRLHEDARTLIDRLHHSHRNSA